MAQRDALQFFLDKSNPAAWEAVLDLTRRVGDDARAAGLSDELVELVNLRVSQINGCAYCLDLHTRYAVNMEMSPQRLGTLAAWWEAKNLYTAQERAALLLAEEVTRIGDIESVQAAQLLAFSELTKEQYAAVQWVAMSMNLTNRISILSHHPARPNKTSRKALGQ